MPKFRLPHGATSVKMQDGTFYRARGSARRGAVVEVDERHAKAMRVQGGVEGAYHEIAYTSPTRAGRSCPGCGFSAYRWQKECPRCGGQTQEDA